MTEPTTEAGRALNATLSYDADPPRYEPGDYIERYRDAILAIEAEARASLTREPGLDVERIAAFLHDEYGCRITCRGGRLADDRHPSHNEAYLAQAERLRAALEEPTRREHE